MNKLYKKICDIYNDKKRRKKIFFQLCRFGTIGVLATITHSIVLIFLVEKMSWQPFFGNIMAFLVAVQVSFWGHKLFSFRNKDKSTIKMFSSFVVVALVGLSLNEIVFWIIVNLMSYSYFWALGIVVSVIPLMQFFIIKKFIFRNAVA